MIMLALLLMCLVPLLLVVSISFSAEESIRIFGYQLIPKIPSFEGYAFLFHQRATMLRTLWMSVLVTALGTSLGIVLNSLMGYVLSRREYRLNKFFVWYVFIPHDLFRRACFKLFYNFPVFKAKRYRLGFDSAHCGKLF